MLALRMFTALFFVAVAVAAPIPGLPGAAPATTTTAAPAADASVDSYCPWGGAFCGDWRKD